MKVIHSDMQSLQKYLADFQKRYNVKTKRSVPTGENKTILVEEKLTYDPELFKNFNKDPPKSKKQSELEQIAEREEFS